MQDPVKISFILTTYNKRDYLKVTLPYMIQQLQPGEELIVIDGNSSDGSVELIHTLVKDHPAIYFLSEKDKGEADGLNKALALCKGEVIKNLTDDDAFDFEAIRRASEQLRKSELDIMGFDGFGLSLHEEKYTFSKTDFKAGFDGYLRFKEPFFFCGLSYLIKRTALPQLGLFSITHKMVDLEYSFRISAGNCKIGWSNLLTFVNIYNANSNTLMMNKALELESIALHRKYRPFGEYMRVYLRFKLQRLLEFKNQVLKKESFGKNNKLSFEEGFNRSLELLQKENAALKSIEFYS